MNDKLTSSVVICTKNRINELKECIDSLLKQSVKPEEIIIVDASDNEITKRYVEDIAKGCPNFIYLHSKKASLTHQRNLGVAKAKGEIILFLDDDVVLDKDYIKYILDVYIKDKEVVIGGVQGTITNLKRDIWLLRFFKKMFFLPTYGNGKMQCSGFPAYLLNPPTIMQTELLTGCSSYRKRVFDDFEFDETLVGYSYMEDDDFSYRVSKKWKLYQTPFAKLLHKQTPISRQSKERYYTMRVFNHYYLFRKNMEKDIKNCLCFLWSHIGLILHSLIIKNRIQAIKGGLIGYYEIVKDILRRRREKALLNHYPDKAEEYWDSRASFGWRWFRSGGYTDIISKYLTNLKPSSLLDVGCGPGRLFPLYKDIKHVVAIDISKKMLERAQEVATKNILLKHISCQEMDFQEGSFDLVLSCKTLQVIPPSFIEHAVKRMCQVAKRYILIIESSIDDGKDWGKYMFKHDYKRLFEKNNMILEERIHLKEFDKNTELFLFRKRI